MQFPSTLNLILLGSFFQICEQAWCGCDWTVLYHVIKLEGAYDINYIVCYMYL